MIKEARKIHFFDKSYLWIEDIILTKLIPCKNPGPIFKYIFKIPIYMYRLGLGKLIGKRVLILVTTGRKTGKQRETPLEYSYDEVHNTYIVMAGWRGKTDWYRNALANPQVKLRVGGKAFVAKVEKLSDKEVADMLHAVTEINPNAVRIWSRWSDETIDNSLESLQKAAKHFPSLRIRPVVNEAR